MLLSFSFSSLALRPKRLTDGHLDFHTPPELSLSSMIFFDGALHQQKPYGLLGTGGGGGGGGGERENGMENESSGPSPCSRKVGI